MCAVCDQEVVPDRDDRCVHQGRNGGWTARCDSCNDAMGWGEGIICNAKDDDHGDATARFVDPGNLETCAAAAGWALIDGCLYCPRCTAGSAERCDYCLDWYWCSDLHGVFVGDWVLLCRADLEEFWREEPGRSDLRR